MILHAKNYNSIKNEFFVKVLFLKIFYFILRFLCENDFRIFRLIEAMEKFPKIHFPIQETNRIFRILSNHKGTVVNWAEKVIWNYADSPFRLKPKSNYN